MLAALAERPFRMLWLASTASSVGSAFASVALAFSVLSIGGTATSLGLVLSAGALAQLVLLLVGGVIADRLPRRRVMVLADLTRMLAQATVAAMLLLGVAHVWELLVANVAVSAASAFFRPASTGLVPQSVSGARLQEANALLSISDSTASFVGPALSGLLVATAGAGWSFVIDAASFASSAALLRAMPALRGPRPTPQRFVSDLAEGWRELIARRWYWLNLMAHALWNLGIAVFLVLGPAIARQRLGGAPGWGLISAGLAGGAIVGGLIALRVRPHRPLVAGNLALVCGALPLLALAGHLRLYAVIICAAIAFAGLAFLNGVWETAIQSIMPAHALSRISSYDSLVSFAVLPVGYAIAGPVGAAIGADPTLAIASAFMVVPCALVSLIPGVRAVVRKPDATIVGPAPKYRSGTSTGGLT
jgi:MFS family permease